MKNALKKILVVLMATMLVLSLASCDKSKSIKKDFEDAGYTVSTVDTNNDTAKGILKLLLSDEQIEKVGEYELILCTNGILNTAIIIKFPSSGELKDFLTTEDSDGKKDTSAYDKAKEDGKINGNCLLITSSSDAKDVFN